MYNLFKYLKENENRYIPEIIEWYRYIDLYYEDKSKIDDEEVFKILYKAYKWLNEFLGDSLNDFDKRKSKMNFYDYTYYLDNKPILAHHTITDTNDIHYENLFKPYSKHMGSFTDYDMINKILLRMLNNYLCEILGMCSLSITFHNEVK